MPEQLTTERRLPDFLIVGAMKCGSTTLFRDLEAHPSVYMPERKEPHALTGERIHTDEGVAEYAALFADARPDQVCGEASTGYTKRPWYADAVAPAKRLLRPDVRLVYIVRDPIARIASHHYHLYANARCEPVIEQTLARDDRLVGYTRYATQIEPWLEAYGPDLVRVVRFETYIADRDAGVRALHEHLGIEPRPLGQDDAVHNKGEAKRVPRALTPVLKSRAYRRVIRSLTPDPLRRLARDRMMPKAPPRPLPPEPATVDRLLDELGPEIERLAELLGLDEPMWDIEALREKHRERYDEARRGRTVEGSAT